MAITSRDQLIAAMGGPACYTGTFSKYLNTTNATVRCLDTFLMPGFVPVGPAAPTTATACDATTPGALPIQPAATSGNTLYLVQFSILGANLPFTLFDRVAHNGGLLSNFASTQSVNVAAGARCASTVGVQAYLEVYGANGFLNTSMTPTISYTNSAGVSGRSATLVTGAPANVGSSMQQFALQSGDVGVSSVQTLTLGVAGTSPGNIGITLARPLIALPTGNAFSARRGHTTLLDVTASPCFMLGYIGSGAPVMGSVTVVEG